jgi:hypothetical protein
MSLRMRPNIVLDNKLFTNILDNNLLWYKINANIAPNRLNITGIHLIEVSINSASINWSPPELNGEI